MTLKSKFHLIIINSILILCFFLTTNCGIYKPADARKIDPNVNERIKKNIEEGRGFRVMGGKKKQSGTFEFASSKGKYHNYTDWKRKLETRLIDNTSVLNIVPLVEASIVVPAFTVNAYL